MDLERARDMIIMDLERARDMIIMASLKRVRDTDPPTLERVTTMDLERASLATVRDMNPCTLERVTTMDLERAMDMMITPEKVTEDPERARVMKGQERVTKDLARVKVM